MAFFLKIPPKKRILIVDDEASVTASIVAALSSNDMYELEVTNNPQEAYQWATTRAYDLLISDLQMPSMHGSDLYLSLGRKAVDDSTKVKRPPLLLISGILDENALQGYSEYLGGVSWLTKPFDISIFRMKVAEALGVTKAFKR